MLQIVYTVIALLWRVGQHSLAREVSEVQFGSENRLTKVLARATDGKHEVRPPNGHAARALVVSKVAP